MLKKLVDKDVYFMNEKKKDGSMSWPGIESVPVDLNGQPFPTGISAADKSANRKRAQEGIEDRFSC